MSTTRASLALALCCVVVGAIGASILPAAAATDPEAGSGRLDIAEALAVTQVPQVQITSPNPAVRQTFTQSVPNIPIVGTAAGNGFARFSLFYGRGLLPREGNWLQLGTTSSTPVGDAVLGTTGVLGTLSIAGPPPNPEIRPGFYTFKLEVGAGSRVFTDFVHFAIENPPMQVTAETAQQVKPAIDAIDAVTARVVWEDFRNGPSNKDIYTCAFHYTLGCGTTLQQVTTDPAFQSDPALAFQGGADVDNFLIVWTDSRNATSDIYLRDLKDVTTAGGQAIAATAIPESNPAIAGTRLIWVGNNDISTCLYNRTTNSCPVQQLTNDATLQANPAISYEPATGKYRLVWQADDPTDAPDTKSDIYLYELPAGTLTKLPDSNPAAPWGNEVQPAISGSLVVWRESLSKALYLYNLDTWELKQVTADGGPELSNSPDISGNRIVWGRNGDIYQYVPGSPGRETQVTLHTGWQENPAIAGSHVVWTDWRNRVGNNGNDDVYYVYLINKSTAPVADAGSDLTVEAGTTVVLDGRGSWDEDFDTLTQFDWQKVLGPASITLANATTATPSFDAPLVTTPTLTTFSLRVFDGEKWSDEAVPPDRVNVLIMPLPPTLTIPAFTPTLSNSGQAPSSAWFRIDVAGTAAGPMEIDLDCLNDGGPPDRHYGSVTQDPFDTPAGACTYSTQGSYTAKVTVVRDLAVATQIAGVTVTAGASPPATPTGLTATAVSSFRIDLAWNPQADATSFRIDRSTTSATSGFSTYATGVTGTAYWDSVLSANTTYYYRLYAVGAGTSSGYAAASATTLPAAPPTPTGLQASPVNISEFQVQWNSVAGATSYQLEASPTGTGSWSQVYSGSGTFLVDWVGTENTWRYYRVRASNAGGSSAWSSTVSSRTDRSQTLLPVADAWTWWTNPDQTSGAAMAGYFGGQDPTGTIIDAETYLKFNVPNLPGEHIKFGILRLRDAGLRFTFNPKVDRTWVTWFESTLTYNNRPGVAASDVGTLYCSNLYDNTACASDSDGNGNLIDPDEWMDASLDVFGTLNIEGVEVSYKVRSPTPTPNTNMGVVYLKEVGAGVEPQLVIFITLGD